ncbi:basic proline-rich protein-like [Dama dama]|uniref:basic proline-rich protein-like n=1 Tax=Dama dama TaxID=30532 RepID=UPI002A36B7F9|nr:basic proline-rich protein-like [Dama dama]
MRPKGSDSRRIVTLQPQGLWDQCPLQWRPEQFMTPPRGAAVATPTTGWHLPHGDAQVHGYHRRPLSPKMACLGRFSPLTGELGRSSTACMHSDPQRRPNPKPPQPLTVRAIGSAGDLQGAVLGQPETPAGGPHRIEGPARPLPPGPLCLAQPLVCGGQAHPLHRGQQAGPRPREGGELTDTIATEGLSKPRGCPVLSSFLMPCFPSVHPPCAHSRVGPLTGPAGCRAGTGAEQLDRLRQDRASVRACPGRCQCGQKLGGPRAGSPTAPTGSRGARGRELWVDPCPDPYSLLPSHQQACDPEIQRLLHTLSRWFFSSLAPSRFHALFPALGPGLQVSPPTGIQPHATSRGHRQVLLPRGKGCLSHELHSGQASRNQKHTCSQLRVPTFLHPASSPRVAHHRAEPGRDPDGRILEPPILTSPPHRGPASRPASRGPKEESTPPPSQYRPQGAGGGFCSPPKSREPGAASRPGHPTLPEKPRPPRQAGHSPLLSVRAPLWAGLGVRGLPRGADGQTGEPREDTVGSRDRAPGGARAGKKCRGLSPRDAGQASPRFWEPPPRRLGEQECALAPAQACLAPQRPTGGPTHPPRPGTACFLEEGPSTHQADRMAGRPGPATSLRAEASLPCGCSSQRSTPTPSADPATSLSGEPGVGGGGFSAGAGQDGDPRGHARRGQGRRDPQGGAAAARQGHAQQRLAKAWGGQDVAEGTDGQPEALEEMVGGGCEGQPCASGALLTARLAGAGGQAPVKPVGLGPAPRVSPGPDSAQPQCPACRQPGLSPHKPPQTPEGGRARPPARLPLPSEEAGDSGRPREAAQETVPAHSVTPGRDIILRPCAHWEQEQQGSPRGPLRQARCSPPPVCPPMVPTLLQVPGWGLDSRGRKPQPAWKLSPPGASLLGTPAPHPQGRQAQAGARPPSPQAGGSGQALCPLGLLLPPWQLRTPPSPHAGLQDSGRHAPVSMLVLQGLSPPPTIHPSTHCTACPPATPVSSPAAAACTGPPAPPPRPHGPTVSPSPTPLLCPPYPTSPLDPAPIEGFPGPSAHLTNTC